MGVWSSWYRWSGCLFMLRYFQDCLLLLGSEQGSEGLEDSVASNGGAHVRLGWRSWLNFG